MDHVLLPLSVDFRYALPGVHIRHSERTKKVHLYRFSLTECSIYQTRALVQTESFLTQLIFEHALRIRVKSSNTSTSSSPPPSDLKKPSQSGRSENKKAAAKSSSSLEGRLNNLISSDLQAITTARDFLILLMNTPLLIALCIWFLYAILGWRYVPMLLGKFITQLDANALVFLTHTQILALSWGWLLFCWVCTFLDSLQRGCMPCKWRCQKQYVPRLLV